MSGRLQGKVCIVTGATSGIGKATAKAFSAEGAKVVFAGRRQELGESIEAELREQGWEATFVRADLSVPEDCKMLVDKTVELYGTLDVLMNNAGMNALKPLVEYDMEEDYDPVMNLNLRASFLLCKYALRIFVEKGKGNIINVASLGAIIGMPLQVSYAASKAGVIQLTRSIAVEYAKKGVRANSISPGLTLTAKIPPEIEGKLRATVPGGGAGTPEGIANAAVFLASDEVPYMSGANLIIDGAANCGPCPDIY